MRIKTSRFLLRGFRESDRMAFVAYQTDPRYRQLYAFGDGERRPHALFDRFLAWQRQRRRRDYQVGIFDAETGRLCGCGGLRMSQAPARTAVFGLELTADDWGRYRLAIDVADALIGYGFRTLDIDRIVGRTTSGNRRAERLARWFGAEVVSYRDGPAWMAARGWIEVEWSLDRDAWREAPQRRRSTAAA